MADDLQEGYEGGLGFEVRAGYGLGAGLVLCGALVYQSYRCRYVGVCRRLLHPAGSVNVYVYRGALMIARIYLCKPDSELSDITAMP